MFRKVFTPNVRLDDWSKRILIVIGWYAVWVAIWLFIRPAVFPSPFDVLGAFPALWLQDGLGTELSISLTTATQALVLSSVISSLAYVSRVPGLRPLATGIAGARFLSPSIFFLLLLFLFHGGHEVKLAMLTMGETFFLTTAMIDIVDAIPEERFDDCRTLRMSEWKATWYVVVRGTLADVIQAIRANNAMGWASLIMVEGIVRSEGGVGVLILNSEKHMNFDSVWAIATAILFVGLGLDFAISVVRLVACPHVEPPTWVQTITRWLASASVLPKAVKGSAT